MNWEEMRDAAIELQRLFDDRNQRIRGASWTKQEVMMGLSTDIGDLVRFAMMVDGRKDPFPDADPRSLLAGELADCLWSIIILANEYNIDLKAAYTNTIIPLISSLTNERQATKSE